MSMLVMSAVIADIMKVRGSLSHTLYSPGDFSVTIMMIASSL